MIAEYWEFICTQCGRSKIWASDPTRPLCRCGCDDYTRRSPEPNMIPDGCLVLWNETI